MSYQKQNFANGEVLSAPQLNHIEDGIVDLESNSSTSFAGKADKSEVQANAKKISAESARAQAAESAINKTISTIIDPTLSISGKAADAKVTGDALARKAVIDDTTVGTDAWSSKHIVDMLCPPLEETGNPVVCYPVSGYPLGVKATWEPVQEGNGTPSPENIRPIKGRDSVTVTRCGENLYNVNHFVGGYWIDDNYHKSNDFVNIHSSFWASYKIPCNVSDTINVSGFPERGGISCVWTSDVSGEKYFKDAGSSLKVNASYAVPSGAQCLVLGVAGKLSVPDANYDNAMISIGASPTTYTPYTGQTATLTLPSTIYGGTVDAVTGEGQKTWTLMDDFFDSHKYIEGAESSGWIQSEDAVAWYTYDLALIPDRQKIIANVFSTVKSITNNLTPYTIGSGNGYFAFRLPRSAAATNDDVRNWLKEHNAQIAFEVKSPTPIVSVGAQPIPALSGVNTVLTDADSVTVTGRADPIKRITDLEDAVASMTTT